MPQKIFNPSLLVLKARLPVAFLMVFVLLFSFVTSYLLVVVICNWVFSDLPRYGS